jgi:hypothetical protein
LPRRGAAPSSDHRPVVMIRRGRSVNSAQERRSSRPPSSSLRSVVISSRRPDHSPFGSGCCIAPLQASLVVFRRAAPIALDRSACGPAIGRGERQSSASQDLLSFGLPANRGEPFDHIARDDVVDGREVHRLKIGSREGVKQRRSHYARPHRSRLQGRVDPRQRT